ncbi:unnamed protein product [Notodromas monacha]|uniref:TauD/TfdA-like domain-containing protein n=1 Tax=Notodromas monacha TaxID=399045 RepID=A0A7R9BY79_9CRUS|nr:unnamed protein product [Notodromas monacha]CAG0923985.1 unnamed protein product [Notodromas monacha]
MLEKFPADRRRSADHRLLGLACYSHDGTGGENSLVDGLTVINQFKAICPDGFDFFSKHAIPSEFREERENRRHHFHSTDYVLKSDPTTGDFVQIRYNVYDRAPMSNLPPDMAAEFYAHYQKLGEIIEEHEKDNWFKLGSGSLVLFDNFRVLHARQAFTGRRVMVSAYVSRGEFLSGARSLGVIP